MRRPIWWAGFLVALETEGGNISRAAQRVGRDRKQVYRRCDTDPVCRAELDAARRRIEAAIAEACTTPARRRCLSD